MPADGQWSHVRLRVTGATNSTQEVTVPTSAGIARTFTYAGAIKYSHAERWARYEADLFGLTLDTTASMTGDPGILWPCIVPGYEPEVIQLWRLTARLIGSPVKAECRWHPAYGEERFISGPVDDNRFKDDVEMARQGFGLLLNIKDEGGRNRLEDDPESGWIELTRRALDMKATHPQWEWQYIASKLSIHPATLREYRRRLKQIRND